MLRVGCRHPDGTLETSPATENFSAVPPPPRRELPHAWLVDDQVGRISTLDQVVKGSFSVVIGLAGTSWADAADILARELGLDLRGVVIDGDAHDAYGKWSRPADIGEEGAPPGPPRRIRRMPRTGWRHRHHRDHLRREALTAVTAEPHEVSFVLDLALLGGDTLGDGPSAVVALMVMHVMVERVASSPTGVSCRCRSPDVCCVPGHCPPRMSRNSDVVTAIHDCRPCAARRRRLSSS